MITPLLAWGESHPIFAVAAALLCLVALVVAYRVATRALGAAVTGLRRIREADRTEDALTYLAAAIATAVAATGMWEFFDQEFGDLPPWLRALLFAFIEIAVITSAVRARRSMRERHSAGVDGMAVWGLTCLSAALSAMEAHSAGAVILRLSAPLVAAWLWERGMAVERVRLTGRTRIAWRITPERIMVALRLADPTDRDASDVAVHGYLTRVALAANALRDLVEAGAPDRTRKRAERRLRRAMDRAVEYAELASEPARVAALMEQLRLLYNTVALSRVHLSSPWEAVSHRPRGVVPALPPVPPEDDPDRQAIPAPEEYAADRAILATLTSKRDMIRHAFATTGSYDVPDAVEWLKARGVLVSRPDAYAVRKADQEATRVETLRAVPPHGA